MWDKLKDQHLHNLEKTRKSWSDPPPFGGQLLRFSEPPGEIAPRIKGLQSDPCTQRLSVEKAPADPADVTAKACSGGASRHVKTPPPNLPPKRKSLGCLVPSPTHQNRQKTYLFPFTTSPTHRLLGEAGETSLEPKRLAGFAEVPTGTAMGPEAPTLAREVGSVPRPKKETPPSFGVLFFSWEFSIFRSCLFLSWGFSMFFFGCFPLQIWV